MNVWFFFSYAHADDNDFLRKFYKDLDSEVRQLTGLSPEEVGFLDREKIAHGATWDATLEDALKNCRIFVPLYSPSYFRALYCGKELAAFRDRLHSHLKQQGQKIDDGLILPVLWNPEHNVLSEIPTPINKIQYKHGSYPNEYTAEGVFQMVKLGVTPNSKYYNEYIDFIRKFAETIIKTAKGLVLPPMTSGLTPLANVVSLFSTSTQPTAYSSTEAGPRYVQFIFVAGNYNELQGAHRKTLKYYGQQGGSDWQPYVDSYAGTAASLAIETIEAFWKDSHYEELVISPGIDQQVRLAASQDKIIVVVADTWTLRLQKYNQLIAPLDQYSSVNCITLIVWNDSDAEANLSRPLLEAAVMGAFQTKAVQNPPNFVSTSIKSYDTFKSELINALGQAQKQILATAAIREALRLSLVETENSEFRKKPLI
jgi:FxsC-like protein